ncbi:putative protein YloA [bioreactor metagenome]|uniref:NFACT RNA-binding domain-containing protein n=1 Tax=bioreactor metagenome TaxID=1076179 RepID=A0A644T0X8_9ZZZZ|nr:NFACT RNA binding domain-containing protein [Negativicutes bacterium]
MSIDGISLSALVIELSNLLTGGRIAKVYQIDKSTLVLWIRQLKRDYCLIISANAENPGIYITSSPSENPAVPPAFCMLIRKHFEEGRISRIYQHSLDRIICLEVDFREDGGGIATKSLTVEIMGKHSNIIFTQDGHIVDAIKRVGANVNRFRQILPGLEYQLPPGQKRLNLLQVSTYEFLAVLRSQNSGLLSKAIINTAAGIGAVISTEIIWRAGLPINIEMGLMDDADFLSVGEAIDSVKKAMQVDEVEPNIVLNDDAGIKAISAIALEHLNKPENNRRVFTSLNEMLDFISTYQKPKSVPDRVLLAKVVESLITRLSRKREVLINELTDAKNANQVRQRGDLLMANLYNINAQASEITIQDFYSDPPQEITIELDPRLTPIENVQVYYNKYAKFKRAHEILVDQLKQCVDEIDYLEGITVAVNNAGSSIEIHEIRQELISQGYLKESVKKRMKVSGKSVPITITTLDGTVIFVGKNNQQNDNVTFKQAGPDDLWLHTKNIPGSHVIIRTGKQHPSESDLFIAAQLAAYFSKARSSSSVPVDYVRRRFVKKPAGAKPGFVIYTNQSTINVTPDEAFVKSVLEIVE